MEPILTDTNRHSVEPRDNKYSLIWDCYQTQINSFWPASKIIFTDDRKQYPLLSDIERNITDNVLGFFSIGDELIMENLNSNFIEEIKIPEIITMLRWQNSIEDIHSQVYNKNVLEVYPLEKDRNRVFNLVKDSEILERKIDFAKKYMDVSVPFNIRIVAFTLYEGVGFSGSFAWIDWLKLKNYKLTGMFHHNDYISNDEFNHTLGGSLIESHIINKASDKVVKECMMELQNIEIDFWKNLIPQYGLSNGMSIDNMILHIKHCTNICANMLNRPKLLYDNDTSTPFKFLKSRSLSTKYNFFEQEGINYRMGSTKNVPVSDSSFNLEGDF